MLAHFLSDFAKLSLHPVIPAFVLAAPWIYHSASLFSWKSVPNPPCCVAPSRWCRAQLDFSVSLMSHHVSIKNWEWEIWFLLKSSMFFITVSWNKITSMYTGVTSKLDIISRAASCGNTTMNRSMKWNQTPLVTGLYMCISCVCRGMVHYATLHVKNT